MQKCMQRIVLSKYYQHYVSLLPCPIECLERQNLCVHPSFSQFTPIKFLVCLLHWIGFDQSHQWC